jgi:hypothetical protein
MHLGTHSHGIHVALTALFQRHGWEVLAEFAPDAEHECGGERFRTGDGVLTVRNPRL